MDGQAALQKRGHAAIIWRFHKVVVQDPGRMKYVFQEMFCSVNGKYPHPRTECGGHIGLLDGRGVPPADPAGSETRDHGGTLQTARKIHRRRAAARRPRAR